MHRGNALADAEAVRARVEGKHEKVQHFLEHEERVIVWVRSGNLLGTEKGAGLKPIHVHGDLRKSLRRVTRELYFEGWCELKHQGRIPREHGDSLRDQIEFVRKLDEGPQSSVDDHTSRVQTHPDGVDQSACYWCCADLGGSGV